jgi:hypothetical protein
VRDYARAWSEPDIGVAKALIRSCMTEDAEIIGPGYHFNGVAAVLAELERFHREQAGTKAVLTSAFDTHGRWTRFTFSVEAPDGSKTQEGWDIVECDAQGLVRRVVTFWGPLPGP